MIIPARYNGPKTSGNGGYSAGLFATRSGWDRPCEVTLRRPPPLDTPLSLVEGQVRAPDGAVIAELSAAEPIGTVVAPVGPAEAAQASRRYRGFVDHPFPTCFVCGPEHPDGLRVFPGRLADGSTAAPWTVPAEVSTELIWAVLDCPGGWAVLGDGPPYVLGRMTAQVQRLPEPGQECVLRGALASADGRKALVHSTLYGPDGAELARARATWIALPA